jgi:hypothetical protein
MRSSWMGVSFGVLPLAALVFGGCFDFTSDCAYFLCPSGSGTGGGSVQPGCDPSTSAGPVADACGVFVSPMGDDGNAGTKEEPLKTITAALGKGTAVYACAGAVPFTEVVTVSKAVTLFGALDCTTWGYDATNKTQLTAAADAVPLTLASTAGGSKVHDFAITAEDAMTAGGSSIAVIANGVMASFTRTDITAGNGKEGLAGTTPTTSVGPMDPTDPTIAGNPGQAACAVTSQQLGGAAVTNPLCASIGGAGGVGSVSSGNNGEASPANAQTALGGQGQPSTDMGTWGCTVGAGANGGNGGSGMPGTGATSSDLGTLDGETGYTGVAGQPGGAGTPGQGGGGGGGAKGASMCAGASGGSGGAGGCGGNGGNGGQPGGASIGILSLGATLVFDAVTVTVGTGGKGGDGGAGEVGGVGGNGGQGGLGNNAGQNLSSACSGGAGGPGGTGGQGGGGRGGHAVGIAYIGMAAPATTGVSFTNQGTPGTGGMGDDAMGHMGSGMAGVAVNVQGF